MLNYLACVYVCVCAHMCVRARVCLDLPRAARSLEKAPQETQSFLTFCLELPLGNFCHGPGLL